MAGADAIVFNVLDVGQGSGNFIEIYEAGNLVSSVLIDMGSTHDSARATLSSERVVRALNAMANNNKGIATIDVLILSHSDVDHINFVKNILDKFNPIKKSKNQNGLIINHVFYGAEYPNYTKDTKHYSFNILAELKNYLPSTVKVESFTVGFTNYEPTKEAALLNIYDNLDIRILIANSPQVRVGKKIDFNKYSLMSKDVNTCSVIPVISFYDPAKSLKRVQYIATGDATGTTLASVNQIFEHNPNVEKLIDNVIMMTLPHHGSYKTTFNLKNASGNPSDANEGNVKNFSGNIRAKSITASASQNDFEHPSAYVMSYFWNYTNNSNAQYQDATIQPYHYYTAFFPERLKYNKSGKQKFPASKHEDWYTVQTVYNVYTNLYFDPNPGTVYTPDSSNTLESGKCYSLIIPPLGANNYVHTYEDPIKPSNLPKLPEWVTWSFKTDHTGTTQVERLTNTTGVSAPCTGLDQERNALPVNSYQPLKPSTMPRRFVRSLRAPSHFASPMPSIIPSSAELNQMQVVS